jgi:PqqD family protein of HPr-rel-A system
MPLASSGAWRLSEGSSLLWRLWDDEYVVFDRGSGDTHLLDLVAGEILQLLEREPETGGALVRRVASALDVPADPALSRHVTQALTKLQAAGLIEPAAP